MKSWKIHKLAPALGVMVLMAAAGSASAQVPPDIEAKLLSIGQIVDPACTAKIYRPLMPANDINSNVTPLYPGIAISRDVPFGKDPKDVVDVFTAAKGRGNRPVLIYVPGGQGNKLEIQAREGNAFYDNIGRWGTKNGMVVVLMQRHAGANWDDPAKDVSAMIQWVQANISKYKGNPERIFAWAHSAGNGPLGTYVGRPELYGPKGVGLKGVVFMSGQFSILPVTVGGGGGPGGGRGGSGRGGSGVPGGPAGGGPGGAVAAGGPGSSCGGGGMAATDGALPGRTAGQPGGPNAPAAPGGGGRGAPVDAATQLARSTLPAYKTTPVKIMLVSAELDAGVTRGQMSAFNVAFHDELCKLGADHCPAMLDAKGETHMSEVFSIDTPDKTVSDPILKWMKSVK